MADFSNPIVIGVTITEYITFMLICIINSKILKSYKNKKQKLSLILLTTFILFSLAPIVHSLDAFFFDSWSLNNLGYIIGLGYSMAMIFAGIANFFLSKFIKNLFEETPKTIISIAIIDILFVVIFAVFKSLNMFLESTLLLGLHVMASIIIYLFLFKISFQIAKKVDKKIDKRGFQFIGLIGIFLTLLYILFIVEAIFFFGQFSIFAIFAWLCGVAGAFCGYIGFCRPNWFKNKYEKPKIS